MFCARPDFNMRGYWDSKVVSEDHRKIAKVEGVVVRCTQRDLKGTSRGLCDPKHVAPEDRRSLPSISSDMRVVVWD